MSWLSDLKIALLERRLERIESLIDSMPEGFESLEEMQEALAYLELAREIFAGEKNRLSEEMERLRKMQRFLEGERHKRLNTHF